MFKLNHETATYEFYPYVVTFLQKGKEIRVYTDSPEGWEKTVAESKTRTGFASKAFVPSQDQLDRLAEINAYDDALHWLRELESYVEVGQIDERTRCPFLKDKLTDEASRGMRLNAQKALLRERLAEHRYRIETGGVVLPNGLRVRTDREDQAMLGNAYNTLYHGFRTVVDWKSPDGWVEVTIDQLEPVARAVSIHVQSCFTAERMVDEKLSVVDDLSALRDFDYQKEFDKTYTILMSNEMSD